MPKRLTDEEVQGRAKRLWARREENGGGITRQEVTELLGVRSYYSAYKLFENRGVAVPEPDDSPVGKMAKKAKILRSSGKDVLTPREVSDLLGLGGASKAGDHYGPIAMRFDVPKMISREEAVEMPSLDRVTFEDTKPSGLQAFPKRRLPDGRVVYELR